MMHKQEVRLKFHGLDHLRSLAIISVLLFHYLIFFEHPSWFPKIIEFGWTGVDLFFVLSGFLIASQLFKQIIKEGGFSMREFYLKRLFRIIPIYLFVVGIYFLIPFFREKEALPPLWKFLTFTQNFNLDATNEGAFSHVWSLCVEEHFYLFLPIILLFFTKFSFKYSYLFLIATFLFGFATRLYGWNTFIDATPSAISPINQWLEIVYYPTYNRLDGLLVGVAIAALYNYLPKSFEKISKHGNILIFIGIIVLSAAYLFASTEMTFSNTIFGFPLISIGFGFIVMGAISSSSFLYRWKSKTSTLIASLSYGIYLIHKGIIHMTHDVFFNWGIEKESNLMLLFSFLFCLITAYILYLLIEKPFMKLRKKFI